MRLEALFQPRSIAVIGASEKPTVGRRMVVSLDRIGFVGAIYPVNPAYPTILGHLYRPGFLGHRIEAYAA
jgi:acetate---CoA ligase (ADP-forming)